jgi:hypothetical protein
MKITLLNDTSDSVNWGCQATSHNIKRIIGTHFHDAQFQSVTNPKLPTKFFKPLRKYFNQSLMNLLADDISNKDEIYRQLSRLNFPDLGSPLPDKIYLNGEGMLHRKSGHLPRLLGTLIHYKNQGVWVGAINQTVDLAPNSPELNVLVQVFSAMDYISVRDPYSYQLLLSAGLENCQLVPDAAFGCVTSTNEEIAEVRGKNGLPNNYIVLTGSSALTEKSISKFGAVYRCLKTLTKLPIVLLGNTKTDYHLAKQVKKNDPSSILISRQTTYKEAMALIAGADLFVSGRFHPMIFAALAGTPLLPLTANTHKNQGLLKMLKYPIDAIDWNDIAALKKGLEVLSLDQEKIVNATQEIAQTYHQETSGIIG